MQCPSLRATVTGLKTGHCQRDAGFAPESGRARITSGMAISAAKSRHRGARRDRSADVQLQRTKTFYLSRPLPDWGRKERAVRSFLTALTLAVTLAGGSAMADPWKDESGNGRRYERGHYEGPPSFGHPAYDRRGYQWQPRVRIPSGHMPPPASCRIWFPDRPAGHQPPPGNCAYLARRVPPGAIFVDGG